MSERVDANVLSERTSQRELKPRPRLRRYLLPFSLVLPIILYEGLLIVYPIAQGIYGSFPRIELASKNPPLWVGWANYERMFSDPAFWKVIRTTLLFTGLVIVVALTIGLLTALLFNRPFRFRPLARGMLMMPWAIPEVPVVMIFIWMLSPQFGVVNILARMLPGVTQNPQWLQVPELAMGWMVLISSWKAFPFYSLVILAALQAIPQELYEAARVDGASRLQLFWNVTFPGIGSTLELLVVLAAIFSFKQFTIIFLMTGGGPSGTTETIVIRIFNTAFRFYDYSYATALGVAGFVVSLAVAFVFILMQARRAQESA
ncbi:MAG: sugar ABC transporter permease [Caldilineaceae bacterium]|nr:sugar ABC transporter permease [Caldilineaceae bacterium]